MGGIVSGIFGGGSAAEEAGEAQLEGTLAGVEEQRRQFDIAQQQIAPFREAGISALQQQLALLGLPSLGAPAVAGAAGDQQVITPAFADYQAQVNAIRSSQGPDIQYQVIGGIGQYTSALERQRRNLPGQGISQQEIDRQIAALGAAPPQFATQAATAQIAPEADLTREGALAAFLETPGQKFLREQQERSLLRSASAIGGLGGGNIRTALQQQAFGRGATQLGEFQNRLAALSGGGQTATQNLAQLGGQTAAGIASGLQAGGQAQASGILGAQQARAGTAGQILGGIGGVLSGGGLLGGIAGLLSDKNMKQDIEDLDLKECFDAVLSMDLKSWRYIESAGIDNDLHFGPMYQDAPEMIKMSKVNMLSLHDEIMMISGAIQYMKNEGLLCLH